MDVNTLLLLKQVADSGSLASAARKLGVSKSTISRKISELEDDLGVRLLERTTRKLGLTAPGRMLVQRARAIADEVTAATEQVRALGEAQGPLRVTASVSMAERMLMPALMEFIAKHPRVELELILSPEEQDLVEEEIDVALRVGGEDPNSALIARKMMQTASYLCASATYLEEYGRPETLEELADHRCIVYRADRRASAWLLEGPAGEVLRYRPTARLIVNSYPVAAEAVRAGHGIGLLPGPFCAPDLSEGTMVRVLPGVRTPLAWMYAAFPSREHQRRAARAFIEFIADHVSDMHWTLER